MTSKVNFDYVKELQGRSGKNKKQADVTEKVLGDSRFKQMFEDTEFAIDKQSENYKVLKPTEGRARIESDEEANSDEDKPAPKSAAPDLNNLFAGKEGDSEGQESASENEEGGTNFEKKLNRDKKKKKDGKKDKIIKNYGLIKQNLDHTASKTIKRSKLKKGAISEQDVRRKLKTKRVVVPSRLMKGSFRVKS